MESLSAWCHKTVASSFWQSCFIASLEITLIYKPWRTKIISDTLPEKSYPSLGMSDQKIFEIHSNIPRLSLSEQPLQNFSWWKEAIWKETCMWVGRKVIFWKKKKNPNRTKPKHIHGCEIGLWKICQGHSMLPWGSWVLSCVPVPTESRSNTLLSYCSIASIFLLLPLCLWLMQECKGPSSVHQPSCLAYPSQRGYGEQLMPSHSSQKTGQSSVSKYGCLFGLSFLVGCLSQAVWV